MRLLINSLADCGMNLCSRSRLTLKTDRSEPSTLHIHIHLRYCTNVNIGLFGGYLWGEAGLCNLSASFLTLGEPAPTGFSKGLQDLKYFALSRNQSCTP